MNQKKQYISNVDLYQTQPKDTQIRPARRALTVNHSQTAVLKQSLLAHPVGRRDKSNTERDLHKPQSNHSQ